LKKDGGLNRIENWKTSSSQEKEVKLEAIMAELEIKFQVLKGETFTLTIPNEVNILYS